MRNHWKSLLFWPCAGIGFATRIPELDRIQIQDRGFEPDSNPGSRIRTECESRVSDAMSWPWAMASHGWPWPAMAAGRARKHAKSLEILAFLAMCRIGFESRIPELNRIRIQNPRVESDSNPRCRVRIGFESTISDSNRIRIQYLGFEAGSNLGSPIRTGVESTTSDSNRIRIQDLGFEPDSNPGSQIPCSGHGPWPAMASHGNQQKHLQKHAQTSRK